MSKGYVYILSNPSMPGLVKIGRTIRSVDGRASELYQTGVPTPFVVEHFVLSPNCVELEGDIHGMMPDLRVGVGREFFRCDAQQARDLLDEALLEQLRNLIFEYTETHILCEEPFALDPGDAAEICSKAVDVHPFEIVSAIRLMAPSVIQGAVEANRDRLRRNSRRGTAVQVVQIQ